MTEAMQSFLPKIGASEKWPDTDVFELERRFVAEKWPVSAGRMGRAEEIGALVAFLASQHAAYITGTNYRIDGGAHATLN